MRVCPTCRNQFPPGARFCPFDGEQLEDLSVKVAQQDELIGTVLEGRYRVEARLGQGGMGVVYAARHVVIDKPVAIKVLRKEYTSDPNQVERFLREAKAASCIGHPNIVDVTDFGTLAGGQIFFVMEFLLGVTLAHELNERGAIPIPRCVALALQICRALAAAHAKGIVHRDLKPENVFLVNPSTRSGGTDECSGHPADTVKILDFGIAKITFDSSGKRLTRAGSVFGTPQYMSPEQAAGQDSDHRGDVYALGCMLYEMLTGEAPFTGNTFMGTLTKHLFEQPVPPQSLRPDLKIGEPLARVVLRALEKKPEDRFQSMAELAEAITVSQRFFESDTIVDSVPAFPAPAGIPPTRMAAPSTPAVAATEAKAPSGRTVHLLEHRRSTPESALAAGAPPSNAFAMGGLPERPATANVRRPRQQPWPWMLGGAGLVLVGVVLGIVLRDRSTEIPRLPSRGHSVGTGLATGTGTAARGPGNGGTHTPAPRDAGAASPREADPHSAGRADQSVPRSPRTKKRGGIANTGVDPALRRGSLTGAQKSDARAPLRGVGGNKKEDLRNPFGRPLPPGAK